VIGFYHAGLETGTAAEYGDCSDVMGCLAASSTPVNLITGGSHHNAPHKVSVGWTLNQPSRALRLNALVTGKALAIAPISWATATLPQIVSLGDANAYGNTFPGLASHFLSYRVQDRTSTVLDVIPLDYQGLNVHQQTAGRSFLIGVLKVAGQSIDLVGKPDFYASITLTGLDASAAYITITYSPGPAPPPTNGPLQYFILPAPVRLVDTRAGNTAIYSGPSAFAAGETRSFNVAGFPGTGVVGAGKALSANLVAVDPLGRK
jgi:hypothetical protein